MGRTLRAAAIVASLFIAAYGVTISDDRADPRWLGILVMMAMLWAIALRPKGLSGLPRSNRALVHLALVFAIGFGLVSMQVLRAQLLDRERILARASDPASGVIDVRRYERERGAERGSILLADGTAIAFDSVDANGVRRRVYANASAAYLAGYYSPGLFGASGLEARYDSELSGARVLDWRTWLDGVLHRPQRGQDVVLTIDRRLQERGQSLLGDRSGGIVVLDANTGAVLALVTSPAYDPNRLSVPLAASPEEIRAAQAYMETLQRDGRGALLVRPLQGLYTPGSIFKTITAAAAFASGVATPDTVYRDDGALVVDSRVIIEQNRPDPSRVSYTVREAYGYSLNVVFAQIGLALGPQRLQAAAQAAGFDQAIPFDLPVAPSRLAVSPDFLTAQAGLAETAFGQGQLQVTPLHMALVTAAVLRHGTMPTPFLVAAIRDADGTTVWRHESRDWRQAFDPAIAEKVKELMQWSVERGYAQEAAIPGVIVGGKTGTAEVGNGNPHAWFIGFAEKGDRRVVVAVVVEHGGSGGRVALPIGRTLLEMAVEGS